ncbi:hypothetical protein [Clostridium sp. UBA1652]|uniref:hypothetical protein n=1 Tax=Clostridium sp. UBA1652 TaxID=1946348 RepID=UPI00257F2F48|nr:hypothetical protein [Clostridium sp. UBA1652]
MVIDDKIPNHIKNANKKYYTYDYKCNICGSEQIILDKFEEYFEKHVICEKYENKDFRKTSETRVSESFYGTLVGDLLDDWEKRLL